MADAWHVRSRELARLRAERMLGIDDVARKAGLSARRVRELEAADRPVFLSTLECLAKVLECSPKEIGRAVLSDAKVGAPPVVAPKPNGAAPAGRPRLSEIVDAEAKLPARPHVAVRGEELPPFTARAYQQCFTAYGVHVGERYVLEGFVEDERGLPPAEAALLGDGARSGIAARFEVRWAIGDAVLGVTVHAKEASHVRELQALNKTRRRVRLVVRVVAPDGIADGGGLAAFARERPGPWGLLVEAMVDDERNVAKRAISRRAR